ncbi:MAG: hypothetical protein KF851_06965 [Pirellulaceae bacterium]|jgi:hypothetical protein|nr:hypothetical protein [Pirellulaceae bacterium]
MSDKSAGDTDFQLEELTAYLDGELSPEASEVVERRLASDSAYRSQLRALEQTWELLEILPPTEPNPSFTKTTMELAVSSAAKSAPSAKKKLPWLPVLLFGLLPLTTLVASYFGARYERLQPFRELVYDLHVIENYDLYRKVDLNLDFVRRIAGELEPDFEGAANPVGFALNESPVTNENVLRSMPAERLRDVQAKQAHYRELNLEEKSRLRAFHESLMEQGDSQQLMSAIRRFYDWLKTIPYEQQVNLLVELETEKKFEIFLRLRRDLSSQVDRLPDSDIKAFNDWLTQVGVSHGEQVRAIVTELVGPMRDEETRERILKSINEDPEIAVRTYLRTVRADRPHVLVDQYADLKGRLSPKGQEMMGDTRSDQDGFVRQMLMRPQIPQEKLENFYFQELTPKEREEFDRLSPEVMRNRVRELYMRRKLLIQPQRR